jgi:hypothetical protein
MPFVLEALTPNRKGPEIRGVRPLGWEGARSKASMTSRDPRKQRWGSPTLDLSSGLRFALRQEVRVAVDPGPRAEAVAHAVLAEAGFEPVGRRGPPGGSSGAPSALAGAWVGERGLRRRGGTAPVVWAPIITVFLAGCVLGGLDAYIVGSLLVGVFWALGAAGASGAFWLRYGRIYDSDLAMVTFSRSPSGAPSGPGSVSVVFWAARVRSQIHSGVRIPTEVSGPFRLAREVGALSREFQRRMRGPESRERSRAVPA